MTRKYIEVPASEGTIDFPKCVFDYEGYWSYPMLEDSDLFGADAELANADERPACAFVGDDVAHPIIAAIVEGGTIEAVETGDEWNDDRCTCMNVVITVDGKRYGVGFWWLSRDGVKTLHKAESLNTKAITDLKEWIRLG
jgi:hypothetical protein